MTQMDLFTPRTRHRRRDRPTSITAAQGTVQFRTITQRRVYTALLAAGADGMTDEELTDRLKMRGSTARTRRSELTILGHVLDSGRTRALVSGRQGVVWITALAPPPGAAHD
jgi:hypothetical protein